MEHKIKNWAQEHPDLLDEKQVPADLWDTIESELNKSNRSKNSIAWRKPFQWVAMLTLLTAAGLWIYQLGKKQGFDEYSKINPELAIEQEAYRKIIVNRKDSLSLLANFNPELSKTFSRSLQEMELNYTKLKNELTKSPNPEKTLQAMIVNLEAQADALQQQLEVFDDYYKPSLKNPTHAL